MQPCTPDKGFGPRHIAASSDDRAIRSSGATTLNQSVEIRSTANAVVAVDDAGAPLKRIQLLPMGEINARDGRRWILADEAHARDVIAATAATAGSADIMGDYDHQAVFNVGPDKGGRAEASGWIKPDSLTVEPDGIWASVAWTDEAAAKLKAKAYRYVSPYFGSDKVTGRITRIFNFGLVNQPAITELAAAAATLLNPAQTPEDNPSMLKTILARLGLAETATEVEVTAALDALAQRAALGESVSAAAVALGLKPEATGEELVTAATQAKAATPDLTKYVPIETHNAATAQLRVINEERGAAAVDKAIESGKIPPANRDWALDQFAQSETKFAAFVANQPAVIDPARPAPDKKVPGSKVELTDEDRQACAVLGIPEDDFLKTRQEERA